MSFKLFDFSWLNSEERKELKRLREENAELVKKIASTPVPEERPYRNILLTNGNITVILNDGSMLYKADVTPDFFSEVKNAKSSEEILRMFTYKEQKITSKIETVEERALVRDNREILRESEDFEIEGNNVYLKGVKLALPAMVEASFIEILEKLALRANEETEYLDKAYTSLKMFWLKLATSPSVESREQVLTFCKRNDIRLSKTGNIIAYRRVVKWENKQVKRAKEINQFAKEQYTLIKARKKGPSNYVVFSEAEGTELKLLDKRGLLTAGFYYGIGDRADYSLKHLVENPISEDGPEHYTSWHNKGKYTFAIGDVYRANEGDINTDAGLCAAGGLHFAACTYNYNGFGDTPIVVLVNPAKTITIPTSEWQKGRTTEMKIVMINPNPHGVHIDESLIEKADEEYNEFTINQLEEAVRDKSFKALSIEEDAPEITMQSLQNITELLRGRVEQFS